MNPKSLLIAVGILAVLGGLVYYTKENPPATGEEKPKLVSVEKDQVQELTVTRPGEDPIVMQREGDKWKFGPPLTIPADSASIGFMADSAAALEADRVVDENVTDWKPYGLDAPSLTVDIKLKDGKSHKVMFGSATPTNTALYARLDNNPRLFTVYTYTKTSFDKKVFDLRDKKLLHANNDKVSHVVVNRDGRTLEFGKSGADSWQILKPSPMRADNFTVGDLVRSLQSAEMTTVVNESDAAAPKPDFGKPYASAEVVDEAGSHTLTFAKAGDKYYAKSSDIEGVYEVSAPTAEGLDKKLEDFRNKKLVDFGFNDPVKLQVRDGESRITVEKKEDKWLLSSDGGRTLDAPKVQTLLDSLRNLSATSFASDNAADQAKYGLGSPAIEVDVTPDEKSPVEQILITSPSADTVYAARKGQPTTYVVEKNTVMEIQHAAAELTKKEAPPATPEKAAPAAKKE